MPSTIFTGAREALGRQDCEPEAPCDPRPACPACGGLECLCRPRFFAGQLLTEEDLNRLDRYIVEKNRLRNRYLHGAGVACGLEVVCPGCETENSRGSVVVRPGYALSPCGNDIVLCRQETVDVCALIERCRPPQPEDCLPGQPGQECPDGPEQWVLAVCYAERPSRGTVSLRGAGAAGCGCDCGRSGACGCTGSPAPRKAAKPAAPQCEPTLVCEGYSFRVYKVPPAKPRRDEPGELPRRLWCCVRGLVEDLQGLPARGADGDRLLEWHRHFRNTVRDFLVAESLYDCEAARRLAAIPEPVPVPGNANPRPAWEEATWGVIAIAAGIVRKCLCSALLPPCPPPAAADCVPLATITLRRSPCRVLRVCNLGPRQFLFSIPNIQHWLSWLPLLRGKDTRTPSLRSILERRCCTPFEDELSFLKPKSPLTPPAPELYLRAAGGKAGTGFGEMLRDALDGKREVDAGTLLLAAIDAADQHGKPLLSAEELDAPVSLLMIHEVLAPAIRTLLPDAGRPKPEPGPVPATPTAAEGGELAAMRDQFAELVRTVGELRDTVERQQRTIDGLRGEGDEHGPA